MTMISPNDVSSPVRANKASSRNAPQSMQPKNQCRSTRVGAGVWSAAEHERYLEAMKIYPNGPWRAVAAYIGTRTVRQTMTHAQKYRQKTARRLRGLRTTQALMRMHVGHQVTEESLQRERMRMLCDQYLEAREKCLAQAPLPDIMSWLAAATAATTAPSTATTLPAIVSSPVPTSLHAITPTLSPSLLPIAPASCPEKISIGGSDDDHTFPALETAAMMSDHEPSMTLEECATELLELLNDQP